MIEVPTNQQALIISWWSEERKPGKSGCEATMLQDLLQDLLQAKCKMRANHNTLVQQGRGLSTTVVLWMHWGAVSSSRLK